MPVTSDGHGDVARGWSIAVGVNDGVRYRFRDRKRDVVQRPPGRSLLSRKVSRRMTSAHRRHRFCRKHELQQRHELRVPARRASEPASATRAHTRTRPEQRGRRGPCRDHSFSCKALARLTGTRSCRLGDHRGPEAVDACVAQRGELGTNMTGRPQRNRQCSLPPRADAPNSSGLRLDDATVVSGISSSGHTNASVSGPAGGNGHNHMRPIHRRSEPPAPLWLSTMSGVPLSPSTNGRPIAVRRPSAKPTADRRPSGPPGGRNHGRCRRSGDEPWRRTITSPNATPAG